MRKLRWRQWIWLSRVIDFLCMMLSMPERPGGLTDSVKDRQACASLVSYTIFQFIISRTVQMCKPAAGMSPAVLKDLVWWGGGGGRFLAWNAHFSSCTRSAINNKKPPTSVLLKCQEAVFTVPITTGSCTAINDKHCELSGLAITWDKIKTLKYP